ncbi:DUF2063 domain-containing protein [Leptospira noumeaensis]|uniref:DUF2063 domain-containing protein n=1 Tax=Leptospira noumeaensis TaxID=2484964 RepID=A0A4R9I946_9LEPT|nr:putative DNA-binding domain-containing protein [Leptospira noumeaensis]TGK81989.1 DUF2063 domain-containing protein [Leptospira noumeaensis]
MKLEKLQNLYSDSILTNKDIPFQNQIVPCQNLTVEEVIFVYKNAYLYRLKEVLADNFEAVHFALGDQLFEFVLEKFIKISHHNSYDLSNYGETFPIFLMETYPEFPYLKELAEFEIQFMECFHEKEHQHFDFANIQNQSELENSIFFFGKSVKLIQNQFSIYSIWKNRKSINPPDLSNVENPEFLLLYKQNSDMYVLNLEPVEYFFINLLSKGEMVGVTLEKTASHFPLDSETVAALFGKISATGIITKISVSTV